MSGNKKQKIKSTKRVFENSVFGRIDAVLENNCHAQGRYQFDFVAYLLENCESLKEEIVKALKPKNPKISASHCVFRVLASKKVIAIRGNLVSLVGFDSLTNDEKNTLKNIAKTQAKKYEVIEN